MPDTRTSALAVAAYATREEARRDVFTFLEVFYNPQPLHSAIGYITPDQMERTAA